MAGHARGICTGFFLLLVSGTGQAGWTDWLEVLKPAPGGGDNASVQPGLQALSDGDIAQGLKQALREGVDHAVAQLGRPGGYLDDARVRIPMPDQLSWVENSLRSLGQDRIADEFVASMNRAAERAVPEVASVFGETIRGMTLDDARAILQGPDDAATRYFRDNSSDALRERMRPIISEATASTGVTSTYKSMMSRAGGLSSLLGTQAVDLDGYVTDRAMDGLFLMIAEQETRIREDPVARSSELLRKVFGAR
jgi:hypothetical protein